MDLRRKLPLLTTALVVALCLTLATAAFVGLNRMMRQTGQQVDERLTALVTDNLTQGAQREREQVLGLIDNARNHVAALAASPSTLSALLADRDEVLKQQAIQPIAAGILELGRAVHSQIDQLSLSLTTNLTTGRHVIEQGGAWASTGEAMAWETTDQSGKVATVGLPPMTIGGQPILVTDDPAQAVPQVDVPATLTGAMFTIFQRAEDDRFVRIATTVQRQGKRAIRTALAPVDKSGAANPVLAEILAGRPFQGLAWVVDRWCVTAYLPVIVDGRVIGMLFAGQPILELPGLAESIGRQKYGASGQAMIVDASGRIVLHPKPELRGKHLLDDLHIDGLKPILTAAADGTAGTCWYSFEGRSQFACYYRIPRWNWTVVATGSAEEIGADLIARVRSRLVGEMGQLYRSATVIVGDEHPAMFGQIRLLDRHGVEQSTLLDGTLKSGPARRVEAPWFTAACADQSNTSRVHPLEVSVNTKRPEIRLTMPIRQGGELVGVVAANFDWSLVQRLIGGHLYGKTGYPWIVNQRGIVVTHPKYTVADGVDVSAEAMGELGERVRQVLATGEPWNGQYTFEGITKFAVILPLAMGQERWLIAVTAPANEVMETAIAIDAEMEQGRRQVAWLLLVASLIVAAAGIGGAIWYVRRLLAPILRTEQVLGGLAQGDLTGRLGMTSEDEFGRMSKALDGGLGGLGSALSGINQNAQSIAGAAEELTAVSRQLTGNAETSASQSSMAATAATEIAASITTFAAGVEEMGVTVGEIAKNASQAASVAQEGVVAAADANTAMTRLGTSSTEIGDIVKLITGIAEQTNLLALNATIEAARAGDAGRGFAVVASEVKDLARKTTEATADIGKRVSGIQGDSKAAQAALSRITDIIGKINDLQQTIATAVEEQSATNKELAGNIGQVAQAGTEISTNVNAVAGAAKEAATGAGETLKAANELAKLAADLRQAVARFRT